MDYNEVINGLSETINRLSINKDFELKDLFVGETWASYSKGDRITLGKIFKSKVLDNEIDGVEFVGRAKNNHSIYKKV